MVQGWVAWWLALLSHSTRGPGSIPGLGHCVRSLHIFPVSAWVSSHSRETRDEIAGPLTQIFVSSLDTGEVPEDWRIANVVPLFMKGSKDNPGNYRPVSLMPVVGKLLEKVLRDRIYTHLELNNLISDRQHGFV